MGAERLWVREFDPGVFERGQGYAARGLVNDLTRTKYGWHAWVSGAEDYEVRIPANMDLFSRDTSCTCPYFAGRGLCKHIAATCIDIDKTGEAQELAAESARAWEKALEGMDGELALTFLRDVLAEDKRWRQEFVLRYGEVDLAQIGMQVAASFTEAVHRYCDRYGRVRWGETYEFEATIRRSISQALEPLANRRLWKETFDASLVVLRKIRCLYVDDSDGIYNSAAEVCFDTWRSMLEQGDDARDVVARGILRFLEEDPGPDEEEDTLWIQQEDARDLFVDAFVDDPERAHFVFSLVRVQLDMYAMGGSLDPERAAQVHRRWCSQQIPVALRAMRAMKKTPEERLAFAEPYSMLATVCVSIVDDVVQVKGLGAAIKLLETARSQAFDKQESYACDLLLAELYEREGTQDKYLACMSRLVCAAPEQEAVSWWQRLRSAAESEQWPTLRTSTLRQAPRHTRYACLAEEKSVDELMAEVLLEQDASAADVYRELLTESHSQEVAALYYKKFQEAIRGASTRKGYAFAFSYLKRMRAVPGAQAEFDRIAQQVRSTYPRRPALLDELSKIGG